MPILIVNGNSYNYPASGEDPNWGEDASAWAVAVTETLETLSGTNDILNSTATISNNISVLENVNGLLFNPTTVRSAFITYSIYRTSADNPSGFVESGYIDIVYDNNAPVNQKWSMTHEKNQNAGIYLIVTDTGQFQYVSTDIGTTGYEGMIKFAAKTFTQV